MKISATTFSRSKWFLQEHYRNGELFHFPNHSKLITSHILILRGRRGYQSGESLVLFLVVFFTGGED